MKVYRLLRLCFVSLEARLKEARLKEASTDYSTGKQVNSSPDKLAPYKLAATSLSERIQDTFGPLIVIPCSVLYSVVVYFHKARIRLL